MEGGGEDSMTRHGGGVGAGAPPLELEMNHLNNLNTGYDDDGNVGGFKLRVKELDELELDDLDGHEHCVCCGGSGNPRSFLHGVQLMLAGAWNFLLSPIGKALTRSWLVLVIPTIMFYIPAVHDFLGRNAFLMVLLPYLFAMFANPCYVGVVVSFAAKLLCGMLIGQVYALLIVGTTIDFWPGVVILLGIMAFLSSYLLQKDLQWGLSLCLAGTINCFFTAKATYAHFVQQGKTGWDIRGEVVLFAAAYAKGILIPSSIGIAVALTISLLVWPSFMFLEFSRMISHRLLDKVMVLHEKLTKLVSERDHDDGFLEGLFEDQQSLFILADKLPYLLTLANLEGGWTLTNLGDYHRKILQPIMQLAYSVTYTSRVFARFLHPDYIPSGLGSISDDVAYRVAKEADSVLHQLKCEEDEAVAKSFSDEFKERLAPAMRIQHEETQSFIHSTRQNLAEFEDVFSRHSFALKRKANRGRSTSHREIPNSEAVIDEIIAKAMAETFDKGGDERRIEMYFKSRRSFLLAFYITSMRQIHSLSRICAQSTVISGSLYGRIFLKFRTMRSLLHIIWVGSTSPKGSDVGSLFRERPTNDAAPGLWARVVGKVFQFVTSKQFKIALRTSIATSLVAMLGFIPRTAGFFDEISGLVAVGFVLFDAGSKYQGHMISKIFFRIAGLAFGILWSILTWYASKTYNITVRFVCSLVLISVLSVIGKVVAAKSRTHSLDWLLLGLYTYTTYVGLSDQCFAQGISSEDCNDKKNGEFILERFINLLIAIFVSILFNLLVFPMRAEYEMKKMCGRVMSDLAMAYGFLMSSLVSRDISQPVQFSQQCWNTSIICLGNAGRLNDLLQYAKREPRWRSYGWSSKHFEALFGDASYIARTLGYASIYLGLMAKNEDSKLFQFTNSARNFAHDFHRSATGKVYRKLRSQVFNSMIYSSYCLNTQDVYPPHFLELSAEELDELIANLAMVYTSNAHQCFFHPDHLFWFDLKRLILVLNYLCKDAQKRCELLFGTTSFNRNTMTV